jgi:dipeptidyl-peptidase-4
VVSSWIGRFGLRYALIEEDVFMRVVSSFLSRVFVSGFVFALCAGVPARVVSADPPNKKAPAEKRLTVERIFSEPPLVSPEPRGVAWLPDSRGITYLVTPKKGEKAAVRLVAREVPSGKERTLCVVDTIAVPADLKRGEPDTLRIRSYDWAPKGDLMEFDFRDEIFTFNRKTGEIRRRTHNKTSEENQAFSPDGKKIAFTRDNDLWVLDLETDLETRLTTTGSDSLYNGVLDWVYEEELFSRGDRRGYWWSPDSRKIVFLQFDESAVPRFPIVDFIPVNNTVEREYYPKPGDHNPVVRVGIADLATSATSWLKLDTSDDSYIGRVHWLRDGANIVVEKLNRAQDRLTLLRADIQTGVAQEILTESSNAWVDVNDATHFYEKSDRFAWSSDGDGYLHLYIYANDGTLERRLTYGDWDVTDLNAVDEKRGLLYFTGLEKSFIERHLYRVSEKGGPITRLTEREGTHAVTFSPDAEYYYDRFSSVIEPRLITVHAASGKELFVLDKAETPELSGFNLPVPSFSTFTTPEGTSFHYAMIKPRDFDPAKKYPVLIYTYGFPNAQEVRNRWGGSMALWHAMIADRGIIVFTMDGRGSYGYGKMWASAARDTIGLAGLEDHLAGVEYLKTLPYIDGSRIGIWGWSGGGTMTALAMLKTPGVFKAGAAVAPVTDWRFYDSIYTERYMKLPSENERGYREASPANFAGHLKGSLLLAHGTADDNVHMQNTIYLVNELTKAGKDYELALYPGGRHGIGGDKTRMHLFTKLTEFFERELLGETAPE